ncbi:MAG: type II secretion system protein N [Pseudomonadota bacterium]
MIRRLFLVLIFVLVAIVSAVAFTPLGFLLNRAGLDAYGVGWSQVDGTLGQGRIDGLYVGAQPVGDVTLTLRPLSLLRLQPTYDVQWSGSGGRGRAVISVLSRRELSASDIRLQHNLAVIEGLALPIRAMGGQLQVRDGLVQLTRTGCTQASGTLSTDILARAAGQYGRTFGQFEGPLSCDAGQFILAMKARSEEADAVDFNAQASLLGSVNARVSVQTPSAEIGLALSQFGFQRRGDLLVYDYNRNPGDVR